MIKNIERRFLIISINFIFIYLIINISIYINESNLFSYFLVQFIPLFGLILLYSVDPTLVKIELIKKITYYYLLIIILSIITISMYIIFLYYSINYKDYLYIWIYYRNIVSILIFIYLIYYFIFMSWTKDNWIKFGVNIFSLLIAGNLLFSAVKLSKSLISISESINIKLDSISSLEKEVKSNEHLSNKMNNNLNLKINLLWGWIKLDLSHTPLKSSLLLDTKLYNSTYIITRSNLNNIDYLSIQSLFKHYGIKNTLDYLKYNNQLYYYEIKEDPIKLNSTYVILNLFKEYNMKYNSNYIKLYFYQGNKVIDFSYSYIFSKNTFNKLICRNPIEIYDKQIICRSVYKANNKYPMFERSYYVINDFNTNIAITTERLKLEKLSLTDWIAYKSLYTNKSTMYQYTGTHEVIYTPQKILDGFCKDVNIYKNLKRDFVGLGIYLQGDNDKKTLIGHIAAYYSVDHVTLAYLLKDNYWRKGYGFEATNAFLKYLTKLPTKLKNFEVIQECIRIPNSKFMVIIKNSNKPSLSLANKLGFIISTPQIYTDSEGNSVTTLFLPEEKVKEYKKII